jgi:molybdopterin-guanine dinucleotide biosynthesis protein B
VALPGGKLANNKPSLNRDIPILDLDNLEEMAEYVLSLTGVLAK